ncbi:UBX domain-containing protein 10 [Protopterus annectens]|uniref:UBX domain-containing protein 10 n=1 Tax=Protopterus annectens TaxID=7888 RepID=UPI001CFAB056|nr:UBX domain-containing protein 10 [Protopterus annectens]XP_043917734.1 UBX domain-containing protein 10 [Protopterus annectens]XP_043917735.1 UBX domain-containing protein 10 [Protopterus annectens]
MASASPMHPPQFERISTLNSGVYTFVVPQGPSMQVTRPKSAKGRTRPGVSYPQYVKTSPDHQIPDPSPVHEYISSPQPPSYERSRSRHSTRHSQVDCKEIPKLLQQLPSRPSSSLNKYRVLPSIERRGSADTAMTMMTKQVSELKLNNSWEEKHFRPIYRPDVLPTSNTVSRHNLSTQQELQFDSPQILLSSELEHLHNSSALGNGDSALHKEPPKDEPRLLLAVRIPSGQRFEHYFHPTDTLQVVIATAESQSNNKYEHCIIETMDVPRRSFRDLTKHLHECGIQNKSVLCILEEDLG